MHSAFVDQNGIVGHYTVGTGVLTLTGSSSVANYQAALRSITFADNADPTGGRTIAFTVNDGDVDSASVDKTIAITAANDRPTMTTTVAPRQFNESDAVAVVDPNLTIVDTDSEIAGAAVSITSAFTPAREALLMSNQLGITAVYDQPSGVSDVDGDDECSELSGCVAIDDVLQRVGCSDAVVAHDRVPGHRHVRRDERRRIAHHRDHCDQRPTRQHPSRSAGSR